MVATKKYICSFCARPFSRSEHKLRHERSHTQTKPFLCLCCNTSFVRRDLLQRHLRNVHKLAPSAVTERSGTITEQQQGSPALPSPEQPEQVLTVQTPANSPPVSQPPASAHNLTNTQHQHQHQRLNNDSAVENDHIIQLLTISRSYTELQSTIKSHLPTLFFLYGTNSKLNIPVGDDDCVYAILANGASFTDINDCINLFNKSWLQSNNDLKSLTILAYTYLENYNSLQNQLLVPIEILFEKLDEVLMDNLSKLLHTSSGTGLNDELNWSFDYWKIYDIQSQYCFKFNKIPPSSHSNYFLKRNLIESRSLNDWIISITKAISFPKDEKFFSILLNCIIDELQNLKFNNNSSNSLTRHDLHNAIIMFNKHYISKFVQNLSSTSSSSSPGTNQFEKLFLISKRHVLLNVPQSFQDLIIDYVLIPQDETHCRLLTLTLKEFEYWNDINPITSAKDFGSWFEDLSIHVLNNNLGLVSYPLLFLGCLPLKTMNFDNGFKIFKNSIVEVFLILLKLIVHLEKHEENVVLRGAIYLIKEMTSPSAASSNETMEKDHLIKNLFNIFANWLDFLDATPSEIDCLKGLFYSYTSPLSTRSTSNVSLDLLSTEALQSSNSISKSSIQEFQSQLHHHQHLLAPQTYPTSSTLQTTASSLDPSPQLSPTLKAVTSPNSSFANYAATNTTTPSAPGSIFGGDLDGKIKLPPLNMMTNGAELNKSYVNGVSIESYKY